MSDRAGSSPDADGIQGRIEREEFSRGHLPEGARPVAPRPAATTVLARPGARAPFELLLLKRPMASRFAAGAYVFPGGVVDDEDGAAFWSDRLPDLPNLPTGGQAATTGAIRELFEETGILLSDGSHGDGREAADESKLEALSAARAALLSDRSTFAEIAGEFAATFRQAPMTYFARWVTPRRLARRYDALFFLVALPDRTHDVTITDEHDAVLWVEPGEALERFRVGELPMLFPTWKTIERLAPFESLSQAVTVLGGTRVESIEPLLDIDGTSVRPRMPDEADEE